MIDCRHPEQKMNKRGINENNTKCSGIVCGVCHVWFTEINGQGQDCAFVAIFMDKLQETWKNLKITSSLWLMTKYGGHASGRNTSIFETQ